MRQALRPVNEVLRAGRFLTIRLPGGAERSMRGHEEIYAAIGEGDAARRARRCAVTSSSSSTTFGRA